MYCGIYKITNKINNQSYIGQSIHIEQRWKEHLRGKGNRSLHKDFLQYGVENFIFEIIEICSESELNKKEQYWIKYYNTYNNGYNLTKGGSNALLSDATKKTIYCYDLKGNYLAKYNSLTEAERSTGINNANISRAAKTGGKTKHYQWSYEYAPKIEQYQRYVGKVGTKGTKKVIQYDLNMNKINSYNSLTEASKKTGVNASSISGVCHNKRKSAGGYIWRLLDNA